MKKIALAVIFSMLMAASAGAEHVGKKECAQGAIESGDRLLQQCVDAPSEPGKEVVDVAAYRVTDGQQESIQTVFPEITTVVTLSASDVNRITCPAGTEGEVNVVFSAEKGITTKVVGRDIFVKFTVFKRTENGVESLQYSTVPTDMYITCGTDIYSLIAVPKKIPSVTVRLQTGKKEVIKKNVSRYAGMSFEKKVIDIIKSVYTDSIPESFTVEPVKKNVGSFQDLIITLERIVSVEGEGLELKEYSIKVKESAKTDMFNLTEKEFLRPDIAGRNAIAISLDLQQLSKGDTARLFILQVKKETGYEDKK